MTTIDKRRVCCEAFAKGQAVRIHTDRVELDLDFVGRWTFQAYNIHDHSEGRPKIYFYESIKAIFVGGVKVL